MYVWNNLIKDDRVKKKAETLSKEHYVKVYSVCREPQASKFLQYSDNIEVHYFWFTKPLQWFWCRSIGNYWFWKNKVSSCDIIDCNDPDTLWAGIHTKKLNSKLKIVYDSHELWRGTIRKEYNLKYTLYSYVINTWQYFIERLLIKHIYRGICVGNEIKDILENDYLKPFTVIENKSSYNPFSNDSKTNSICFFGSKIRLGITKVGTYFNEFGITPISIGGIVDNDNWVNKGFLERKDFKREMAKCKYGLLIFDITCNNIKYCMPNKLFEYIQAECPIISNKGLVAVNNFIRKYDIGVITNNDRENCIKDAIIDLENNYNKYLRNIQKIKKQMSWENQEAKLLEVYAFK
jgi:hypothetical protein